MSQFSQALVLFCLISHGGYCYSTTIRTEQENAVKKTINLFEKTLAKIDRIGKKDKDTDTDNNNITINTRNEATLLLLRSLDVERRTLNSSQMSEFIAAHNEVRAEVAINATLMYKMRWSSSLASFAQEYANKCTWAHNPESNTEHTYLGENLYLTTEKSFAPTKVVGAWVKESQYYSYSKHSCSQICGHYTQVIWDNTMEVGCGASHCASVKNYGNLNAWIVVCNYSPGVKNYGNLNAWIVVCNYSPGGNYPRRPYYYGNPCSSCPSGHKCTNNLCE